MAGRRRAGFAVLGLCTLMGCTPAQGAAWLPAVRVEMALVQRRGAGRRLEAVQGGVRLAWDLDRAATPAAREVAGFEPAPARRCTDSAICGWVSREETQARQRWEERER